MKVNVYICYWRDIGLLRLTLPMLLPHIENIFVHDGRFEGFPDEGMYSNDGVKEECEKHPNVHYIRGDRIYETQVEKRNMMFQFMPAEEWILVIDADEVLFNAGRIQEPPKGFITGKALELTEIGGMMFGLWHYRLMKNVPKLSYEQNHFSLTYKGKAVTEDYRSEVTFMHIRTARTKERMRKTHEYYRKREETGVEMIELEKIGTSAKEIERKFKEHGYFRIR